MWSTFSVGNYVSPKGTASFGRPPKGYQGAFKSFPCRFSCIWRFATPPQINGGFWKIFPTEHWWIFESWSLAKGILTQKIKKGSPQNRENTSKWALWSKWNSRSSSQNLKSCSFWTQKLKNVDFGQQSSMFWPPSTVFSKYNLCGKCVLRRVYVSKIIKTL